jgi:periplasmic protein TonB
MKQKKTDDANLEKKRGTFFFLGLSATLALILSAFVWSSYDINIRLMGELQLDLAEEEVIPPNMVTPPPPPPPPQVTTVIEIVDDKEIIEEKEDLFVEQDVTADIQIIDIPTSEPEEDEIFMVVEKMPTLPACKNLANDEERNQCTQMEIIKLVQGNAKYPPIAKEAGIQGTVFVYFEVNKDGKVENVEIKKSVDKRLDEEAVKAVKMLPTFDPGKQRGKPVRVQYTIPVRFVIK